jgi:hypothetical protein
MRITDRIRKNIAVTAAAALVAERRDVAYDKARKGLTAIAGRQFSGVPLDDMKKYRRYITFRNTMKSGKGYPEGFMAAERSRLYRVLGFIKSSEIPMPQDFPVEADEYSITVDQEFAEDYARAVRDYMLLYFEAEAAYKIIFEALMNAHTEKQLSENLPELLEFYILHKKPEAKETEKPDVLTEAFKRCKDLLQKQMLKVS